MKSIEELYVATDGESLYDEDGHTYTLNTYSLTKIGGSKEEAEKVCDTLNSYAYPQLIKVAKVEVFVKLNF